MTARRILRYLTPASPLDYVDFAIFLGAVVRLMVVKGFDLRILWLFVVPPVLAWVAHQGSERLSTRLLASAFLYLVDVGIVIAPFHWFMPHFGSLTKAQLYVSDKRLLSWYFLVYVGFLFGAVPVTLFGRVLRDPKTRADPAFSKFVCYLGLFTGLFVGTSMIVVFADMFHVLPLF